jgi:hypothetical protein
LSAWSADRFRLTVRPTVFHPRYFIASEYFSRFVTQLNLRDLRVADVGTGIIALLAARPPASRAVTASTCCCRRTPTSA